MSVSQTAVPPGRLLGPLFEAPPRAPYATRPADSRGRFHREEEGATRTCYQRDRDRVVHSAAFRRLKHKTQVFVQHEGDYYRTRLTHSLEVAQIARSVARVLGLDEDLAEAVALSHDLGHTPFGHAGEDALAAAMAEFGGFDHNGQALRLVTSLEHRYAAFDGLNLTWEALEGLVKHNGPLLGEGRGRETLSRAIAEFNAVWDLDLASQAGLEAQVAALADDIAYANHDLDDGLRAGLFAVSDLFDVPLAGPMFRALSQGQPGIDLGRIIGESVRRLISQMVDDLVAETRRRLADARPASAAELRALARPMAAFSEAMLRDLGLLKAFLFRRMYRHARVNEAMGRAKRIVTDLFGAYLERPTLMPEEWSRLCGPSGDTRTARVACDYIAGMTDRFAMQEHARIFHMELAI